MWKNMWKTYIKTSWIKYPTHSMGQNGSDVLSSDADIEVDCFWWMFKKSGQDFMRKARKDLDITISHRIHGAGIYANIWGILMVNVTIYSIHGSYGFEIFDF
jgi:hypothetical protein